MTDAIGDSYNEIACLRLKKPSPIHSSLALGTLAEEASSELVQAELAAMQDAIRDAAKNIAERIGLSSSLKAIQEEFDGVEIDGNTPMSVLNDLMSRYQKQLTPRDNSSLRRNND